MDKARTAEIGPDGATVGVLHTGLSYADDLFDDGIVYHYPTTRSAGRDAAEVSATKAAQRVGLPIFVVTRPTPYSKYRNIDLGWVEAFDDAERIFLIEFGETAPPPPPPVESEESEPFSATDTGPAKRSTTTIRPGQARFKFRVLRRYGAECAVCGLDLERLLDAAHIRSRRENGSDDPRNGLVLCATHHRAYDAGYFAIEPESYDLAFLIDGPSADDLRISRDSLSGLKRKPHPEVLTWRWTAWAKASREGATPALT